MLTQVKFAPGIDKQDTSVGATGRWVDSDLTRFRYGLPEKIGGWSSLLTDTIVGVARKQHSFVDKDGNVLYKGIEQPKLKGTLKPTKVKTRKKVKKKKTDKFTKLAKAYKEKQKLKRALNKQKNFLDGKVKN